MRQPATETAGTVRDGIPERRVRLAERLQPRHAAAGDGATGSILNAVRPRSDPSVDVQRAERRRAFGRTAATNDDSLTECTMPAQKSVVRGDSDLVAWAFGAVAAAAPDPKVWRIDTMSTRRFWTCRARRLVAQAVAPLATEYRNDAIRQS